MGAQTSPNLFELPPPSTNVLFAATWSAVTVAQGNIIKLTLTTNLPLNVIAVTKAAYEQFNSCSQVPLPSDISATSSGEAFFGMKPTTSFGTCISALANTNGNVWHFSVVSFIRLRRRLIFFKAISSCYHFASFYSSFVTKKKYDDASALCALSQRQTASVTSNFGSSSVYFIIYPTSLTTPWVSITDLSASVGCNSGVWKGIISCARPVVAFLPLLRLCGTGRWSMDSLSLVSLLRFSSVEPGTRDRIS